MARFPSDVRAQGRELVLGTLTFFAGALGVLIGLGKLMLRELGPHARWWEVLSSVLPLLLISFYAGLYLALAAGYLLRRLHYRLGVYRCAFCSRPLKSESVLCPCRRQEIGDLPALQVEESTTWCWQNIRWVLLGYVVLIPIAMAGIRMRPGPETQPIWFLVAQLHFVICALVAASLELLASALRWLHRGGATVRRLEAFVVPFVLWPLIGSMVMIVLMIMGAA